MNMRKPTMDMRMFKSRRETLAKKISGSALIVVSQPEAIRNSDVGHPYRQHSDLFYLTGFEEPDSILVFCPGQVPESVMFVRHRDPEKETWNGFRYGPEGAETYFGIDKAYTISEFEQKAPELLKAVDKVYYTLFVNSETDQRVKNVILAAKRLAGRTGRGLPPIYDASTLIGEERVIKSPAEIEILRSAADISASAHIAAMKFTRPGVNEREISAVFQHALLMGGCQRVGFETIVAAGNNATTLHYVFNDQVCQNNQLVLLDGGGEFNYYSGDITRTWPVNGKFTPVQKAFYQGVLNVQKNIIDMIRPGVPFQTLRDEAVNLLTELMMKLGLFTGRTEDIVRSGEYKKYYPHSVSHWLGMDVHDVGLYVDGNDPRKLVPGMCLTVEPGLYIPEDAKDAPAELRGLGVRIEDDILVTEDGNENLTIKAPKEVADIEAIVGTRN